MAASPGFRGQLSLPFAADIYVFPPLSLLASRAPLLSEGRSLRANAECAIRAWIVVGVERCGNVLVVGMLCTSARTLVRLKSRQRLFWQPVPSANKVYRSRICSVCAYEALLFQSKYRYVVFFSSSLRVSCVPRSGDCRVRYSSGCTLSAKDRKLVQLSRNISSTAQFVYSLVYTSTIIAFPLRLSSLVVYRGMPRTCARRFSYQRPYSGCTPPIIPPAPAACAL